MTDRFQSPIVCVSLHIRKATVHFKAPHSSPCTMSGQEVNETSCLVHAPIPLSSKKPDPSQREAFFFSAYTSSSGRGEGPARTAVHCTALYQAIWDSLCVLVFYAKPWHLTLQDWNVLVPQTHSILMRWKAEVSDAAMSCPPLASWCILCHLLCFLAA